MPHTVTTTTTLYKFDELSESVQDAAVEKLWDLNVDHEWWDSTYEMASAIGLEIDEFDVDRHQINGKLSESLPDCCKLIRRDHGKDCDTFKTAKAWLANYIEAFKKWLAAKDEDDMESWELEWSRKDWHDEFHSSDEAEEITENFQRALLEDFLSILRNEYEYQASRERVIESIHAMEYEFTEDGELA